MVDVGAVHGRHESQHVRPEVVAVDQKIDQAEEVEDVGVIGAQLLRTLQLPARLGLASVLKRLAPTVVMQKKNALIKGRVQRRFRHQK